MLFRSGINFGGGGEGIRTASMLGYNYNDEWNKKTLFNNSYFFNNTDAKFNTLSNSLYNDGRNVIGNRNGNSRNASHNLNLSIEMPLDSVTTLTVSPKFSYGKQSSNSTNTDSTYRDLNDLANSTKGANTSLMKRVGFENNIYITRILSKKGRSIGLNFTNSYYTNEGNARNYSEQHFFDNNVLDSTQILNQQNLIDGRNEKYDAQLSYSEPLSKTLKMNVSYRYSYGVSTSNRNTYNYDEGSKGYTDLDSLYTNRFRTTTTTQQPNIAFNYNSKSKKLSASLGGSVYFNTLDNKSYLDNTSFHQQTTNIAPNSRLQYTLKNKGNLQFNYSGYMNQPSLEQLQPVRDNTNPLNVRLGNPDLKPSFSHNISIGYNKYSMTGLGVFSSFSFSPTINRISSVTKVNSNGGQTVQFINVDGTFNSYANVNINYNKKRKNDNIRFNGGFFGNLSRNKNYSNINNTKGDTTVRENISTNWSISPMLNASYSYKELFDFSLNYRPSYNQVLSQLNNVTTSNFSQRLSAGASLYLPMGMILENDLAYTYNSRTAPGFKKGVPVYSAAIGYEFLKNRSAQVKLYGYDLFRQNTNIRRYVTEVGTFDTQTVLVEQYFMLTFTYNISVFGAKGKSTRRNENRPFYFF